MGHNDAYYELQSSAKILKLDALHRIATGKRVSVAQIDTGVDLSHPDLDGQLAEAKNSVTAAGIERNRMAPALPVSSSRRPTMELVSSGAPAPH
jgi:hypothetical protein